MILFNCYGIMPHENMQNVNNISFVSQKSLLSKVIANSNQHKVKTDFGDDASIDLKLAPLKLSQILVFDITYQPYITVAQLSYHDCSKALNDIIFICMLLVKMFAWFLSKNLKNIFFGTSKFPIN